MLFLTLCILIIVILHFINSMLVDTRDYDIHLTIYENQKLIIANQHAAAEALILIMRLVADKEMQKHQKTLNQLSSRIEKNLPN